jgi:C-3',4' desaturase CrtD
MTHSLIIGAGIGGLTTAALLLQAGHQVTVLEAHVYPGGCAGTFFHKGFRFDAGATLAGGFAPGGPHARLAEMLELTWPVSPVDPAWVVHLPDGRTITQWADPERWRMERQAIFPQAESFWQTQEKLAAVAWDVSSRPFPWPPQSTQDMLTLARAMRPQTALALPYLWRTIGQIAPIDDPLFQAFLDAQLLISAQTTSQNAHALYGSTALDLPRRGVNHVQGGIGALAETLVAWIRQQGGVVHFRQQVERIIVEKGRSTAVTTRKGLHLTADHVIANVTPWALTSLLGKAAPRSLRRETAERPPTWGAFTLYLGLDERQLPPDLATHHQVIVDETRPLGEGNSVFISLSKPGELARAPAGMRAATLSTHTAVTPWQQLHQAESPVAYCERREMYTNRLLAAAERAIPGIRRAVRLMLPGTPITFAFYTRRPSGMVGGFPQTSLFQARGPATGISNLWLVGDSIFPGQSTAGVTLGGMRVANTILGY